MTEKGKYLLIIPVSSEVSWVSKSPGLLNNILQVFIGFALKGFTVC